MNELVSISMGYMRSRVLTAAARLGVADGLASGARTVAELATRCGADAGALHRLLRALASMGIVAEVEPGMFALTRMGMPLRRDAEHSAWPGVVFWGDLLAHSWADLTECVRTGERSTGGAARWRTDPEAGGVFRAVMGTGPKEDFAAIASAWEFGRYGLVADLGGGGGGLLLAVLARYPEVRGLLVDRAETIAGLRDVPFEAVAADLLDGVPGGADVYLLKHVLHGYDDANAVRILRHCAEALRPDGRVLVVEFVLPPVVGEVDAELEKRLLSDLNMLAVTGGRERTEAEWLRLLERAGLALAGVTPVAGDLTSIVEARRF